MDDPSLMGDWLTEDLKQRKRDRNLEQIRLRRKGKKAEEREKKAWRTARNKLSRDMRKAKFVAMKKRAENNLENTKDLFSAVKDMLGWRTGGAPDMLVSDGTITRNPQKMANVLQTAYADKLKEVEEKLGPPRGNYL
jgi:hypothetical protein